MSVNGAANAAPLPWSHPLQDLREQCAHCCLVSHQTLLVVCVTVRPSTPPEMISRYRSAASS